MGMSQSQIELLINARNNAQGAFDQLSSQIQKVTGATGQGSEAMDKHSAATQRAGVASQATAVAVGMLVDRLMTGLVGAFKETINEANRFDAGMIGLSSVAKAFHQDAGAASEAAQSLASDGLMTVGEAAASLKNLLATGFSLPEAITLMGRFKDSAAFGRQGTLGFGEAIVGATEGIKNGNSALVDNMGLTKNLSNILVEAGHSQQDLSKVTSDAAVRQSLYNGLLKETVPQLGDAARYLDTAAGKQQQFSSQIDIAQMKIGRELQPALLGMINALTPIVRVVGENADVFVRLAAVLASVVAPMAALRLSTELGIPKLIDMAVSGGKMLTVFSGGVGGLADARAGIQLIGEGAGFTTSNLGMMGSAASVVGVAFAGWQIGRLIGEVTGLDGALQGLFERMRGVNREQVAAEVAQHSIELAVMRGAAATITYADAVKYNADMEAIRLAKFNQAAPVQKAAIDAEVDLGKRTKESGEAAKAAIDHEAALQSKRQNRISVTDAAAKSDKAVRDELNALGMTVGTATGLLAKNESGFRAWADANKLSKDTVDAVEAALKRQAEGHKKVQEAAKAQRDEMEKLDAALSGMGVVTREQVNKELKDLQDLMLAATAGGVKQEAATAALLPKLQELADKAKKSGVEVAGLDSALRAANAAMGALIPNVDIQTGSLTGMLAGFKSATNGIDEHQLALDTAKGAYARFGITSRDELKKTADSAERDYAAIVAVVGKTAPEAVTAFRKMTDAQKAASGELPSYWEKDVAPVMIRTIDTVKQAVDGSFAQMLLGTKSFKDGFLDIWDSLKKGLENILASVLQSFTDSFLNGLMGAMQGKKGSFSQAFSGLFGGGGGGGFSGLFGGGGAAAMGGAAAVGGTAFGINLGSNGLPISSPFDVAASGGTNWGAMAGGGLMAATGAMSLWQQASQGNKLGSTLAGAQTGAGIGTMIMPGVGTAIGAGIGAAGGFVASLFGGGKGGRAAVDEFANSMGGFDALHKKLGELGADGEAMWVRITQGVGKNDKAGAQAAIQAVVDSLAKHNDKLAAAAAAAGQYGMTWEDMDKTVQQSKISEVAQKLLTDQVALEAQGYRHDAVLKKQAGSYSALVEKSAELKTEIPESLRPILQSLADMGLLLDSDGAKIDLAGVQFAGMGAAADAAAKVAAEGAARAAVQMDALKASVAGLTTNELAALGDSGQAALNKLLAGIQDSSGSLEGMGAAISGAQADMAFLGEDGQAVMAKLLESIKATTVDGLDAMGGSGEAAAEQVRESLRKLAAQEFPGLSEAGVQAMDAIRAATGLNSSELSQFGTIGEAKLKALADTMRQLLPAADMVADGLRDRFGSLSFDPITLDVNVETHGMPGGGKGGDGAGGEITVQGAAGGGLYQAPTFRILAEKEPELVGSPNMMVAALSQAMRQNGGFGGDSGGIMVVLKELARTIRDLPNDMRRSLRDAVLQG